MPKYGNIFLTDTLETYSYSGTGGGKQPRLPPIPNRQAHSSKLQQQFSVAQAQFNAYIPTQTAAIGQSRGTFLEFTGAQDCDLITKSLESPRSGIHLMNVRNIESVGSRKLEAYGEKFTRCIKEYLDEIGENYSQSQSEITQTVRSHKVSIACKGDEKYIEIQRAIQDTNRKVLILIGDSYTDTELRNTTQELLSIGKPYPNGMFYMKFIVCGDSKQRNIANKTVKFFYIVDKTDGTTKELIN